MMRYPSKKVTKKIERNEVFYKAEYLSCQICSSLSMRSIARAAFFAAPIA